MNNSSADTTAMGRPALTSARIVVTILICVSTCTLAQAADLVFYGAPPRVCSMGGVKAECHDLTGEQREAYRAVIVRDGQRYFWKSREGREMFRTESGTFTQYTEANGNGFVKVQTGGSYLKVVHIGLTAIGYWGRAEQ